MYYYPEGIHSIKFGNKHTWNDWHLIPTIRPVFATPPVKTKYVDIPGANGQLDLTEIITGRPIFDVRKGQFEFLVDNNYENYDTVYLKVLNYLHGQKLEAILDDDPTHYYSGRFTVSQWRSSKTNSSIVIDYVVDPYRREILSSIDDWLWDPFNFEIGVIRLTKNVTISGTKTLELGYIYEPVKPVFTASAAMTIRYNNKNYSIPSGTNSVEGFVLFGETNTLTVTGNGTLTINYRAGML